jgi:biotin carboxyl carrier protein
MKTSMSAQSATVPHTEIAVAEAGQHAHADTAQLLVELSAELLSASRFDEAAIRLAGALAARFACTRVSIGRRDGGSSRVVAISNLADLRDSQSLLTDLAAAMDEALDQGASVNCPTKLGVITLAHRQLMQRHGSAAVLTVPLAASGVTVGALTLERAAAFDADTVIQIEQVGELLGPMLDLRHAADAPLWRLGRQRLRRRVAAVFGQRVRLSYLIAALVILLTALAFIPVTDRIGAPARLEGEVQRLLVAPADGFLRHVYARPGDMVKANQVLAELDQDDMALEQRKWQSEISQYQKQVGDALATQDRAAFAISQAKLEQAQAEADLAAQTLARAQVRAPFDGIVLEGDLSQSLGAPVKRGDTLMTVAPRQRFRVIVEVDERDIARARLGEHGRLTLAAQPGEPLDFDVRRISPVAIARDGRNFFEVEGALASAPPLLNPGLKGVANIAAGQASMGWVWTHRALDWLRYKLG